MSTSTHHDLILLFENTIEKEHDLVLLVGREPNNPLPFSRAVGTYDFRAQRRADGKLRTCAFWDQSYGTLAKAAGTSIHALKNACEARASSPVAFTDVSPVPVAYSPGSLGMKAARAALTPALIDAHVESIFSLSEVMDRVALVVLAGHRHGSFGKRERENLALASGRFARRCAEVGKPYVETRFMYGNNQRANIETLRSSDAASAAIARVLGDFLEPEPVELPRAA